MIHSKKPYGYNKQTLRILFGMERDRNQFAEWMSIIYPELKSKFPDYKKNCHNLTPAQFKWLCDERGLERKEIVDILKYHFNINISSEIEVVENMFGVNKQPFFLGK